ncbi:MAG: BamA/TamA family outer membrane protein [Planctomycetes bacterium]|nr:BamA/TamA family outer membrane protein [Planctomycetota bacterium]MCB9905753.1 BamA/TamA family outer membrane protein [Planctomycetota bacterium]
MTFAHLLNAVARALICAAVLLPPARAQDGGQEQRMPTVVGIEVTGEDRYAEDRLIAALGQRVGRPLDRELVERGITYLWEAFKVRAEVLERAAEGGIELQLIVQEMPVDLEPRFIGYDGVKLKDLREWAGLDESSELYLHQARRVRQRLLEGYRRKGFHFVEIDIVTKTPDEFDEDTHGIGDVIFRIREGRKVRVSDVVVHGNESLPTRGFGPWKDGLVPVARTQLKGPRFLNWLGDVFVEEKLEGDLLAMRNVYRDRGYLDAVVELDRLEFNEDFSRVVIHVVVDEGDPYTVSSLHIVGVKQLPDTRGLDGEPLTEPAELVFSEPELLGRCMLKPGVTFEKLRLDADREDLRDFFGALGYLSHPSLRDQSWKFLEPELVFDVENKSVEVTYRIVQGQQLKIREVRISGANHTRDRVLRREITVQPGQIADMKEVARSLRLLTATGYFSDDRRPLEHNEPTYRFLPTDDPEWVDIEFIVEEGRVVDFEIAGGVDSNSGIFGILSLQMRNFDITDLPSGFFSSFGEIYRKEAFHGAGQTLDIQLSPGSQVDFTRIHFVEPDIFRRHFNRWSLDVDFIIRDRIYEVYDEGRLRFKPRIGRQLGLYWTLFTGVSLERVEVSDLDTNQPLPPDLIAQEGKTTLNSLLLDVTYRDVDSRLNPRDGESLTIFNSAYTEALGSDADFFKTELAYESYWVTGDETTDVKPSFKFAAGAGLAQPYADTDDVPYTERFFLGGFRTLRGFEYRGVGPNVGDTAIGGETMLRGSLEFRYPLYSTTRPGTFRKQEMLRFLLFTDAGILDQDAFALDPDELRASVGFGFGLTVPFPLVLNFGFPVKKGDGDRRQVFSFNLAFN